MSTIEKYLLGSQASLMTTELNALANNSLAIATSAFNNTVSGGGGDGYVLCDLELVVGFHTSSDNDAAPTANTGITLWFLTTQDGTNYEDGGSSVTPARLPDVVFPLNASTGAQRIIRRVLLPWGNFKPLLKNDGTGKAMNSLSNTLKVRPVTPQGV